MSSKHCGYIVEVKDLRPHTNADRLQVATFFGNDVIVDLDVHVGDCGIYFPIGLQLSEEYCKVNDLVRRKDENGKPAGGYLDPNKRNITAMKLRGEKSDGLFMPLSSLDYTKARNLKVGQEIIILNGHEICGKYIPSISQDMEATVYMNKMRRKMSSLISPLFKEHVDTEQLDYHLDAFRPGDLIEITLKMHGTSQRTGYLPKLNGYTSDNPFYNWLIQKDINELPKFLHRLHEKAMETASPKYDYGYISGTRRTIIEDTSLDPKDPILYRNLCANEFAEKLYKGETVYYEIVGFTNLKTPIMGQAANSKTKDKDFIKYYGPITTFSYGCNADIAPNYDFYVYRMTGTLPDGRVIEYPPDLMRQRCDTMGVKTVPLFYRGIIPDTLNTEEAGKFVKNKCLEFYDGPDPIGHTHIREGVVARIVNRPNFTAFKIKNFSFKVLEGLITVPDVEEMEDIL